jgi:dihydrofolate synthase/folylpolyglutamate synthase
VKEEFFNVEPIDEVLADWLGLHFNGEIFRPGFKRIEEIFSPILSSLKKRKIKTAIIGGTNGKGEVTLLLEHLACHNNYRPFVWMSPHIISARERFCCDGKPIEGEKLLSLFNKYCHLTSELSYYEFLFYCFCQYVEDSLENEVCSKKSILFLEVGLGGRLDATNLFDCDVACLTSIGRDHMGMLGNSLSAILGEKIMISRPGKPLVTTVRQSFLRDQISRFCSDHGVEHDDLFEGKEPLNSDDHFRIANKKLALAVWQKISDSRVDCVTQLLPHNLELWGRPLMVTYVKSKFILLGTHNLDGLRSLLKYLVDKKNLSKDLKNPADEVWVALTRESKQEVKDFINLVIASPCLAKKIVLTTFDHDRATSVTLMNEVVSELGLLSDHVVVIKDWKTRIENNKAASHITILGSYYFIGEVYRTIHRLKSDQRGKLGT